jgi:glutamyl-tRNA synthetase
MTIRTRFAPSPTGDLHIGSVRTALFSYLFAKKQGGEFLLRIEDTDLERSTQASLDVIIDGMDWLGLHSDEKPILQSEKIKEYQDIAHQLIEQGHAYRCYCSKERLATLREQQMADKQKPRYDGHCRDLPPQNLEAPHVIRFKTPKTGSVAFSDLIHGDIEVQNEELDDLVIIRQDGMPTYNMSVVVDDHDSGITHVLRGDDHINNTPRQIHLYRALGWEPPLFGHTPMILGPDGKRLSKRHGATNVLTYQENGYLPQALLNFLVRLGWSHGDQEIFTLDEMIALFDLKHVSLSCAAVNVEKLGWLNQQHMKMLSSEELAVQAEPFFHALGLNEGPAILDIVPLMVDRAKTLKELAQRSRFFFELDFTTVEPDLLAKLNTPEAKQVLEGALEVFSAVEDWQSAPIHDGIKALCEKLGFKMGQVGPVLRIALTGTMQSPALDQTLAVLGQSTVIKRLKICVDRGSLQA